MAGVELSISGLPAGVTATFPLNTGICTLQLDAAPNAPRFVTSTLTISGPSAR